MVVINWYYAKQTTFIFFFIAKLSTLERYVISMRTACVSCAVYC